MLQTLLDILAYFWSWPVDVLRSIRVDLLIIQTPFREAITSSANIYDLYCYNVSYILHTNILMLCTENR